MLIIGFMISSDYAETPHQHNGRHQQMALDYYASVPPASLHTAATNTQVNHYSFSHKMLVRQLSIYMYQFEGSSSCTLRALFVSILYGIKIMRCTKKLSLWAVTLLDLMLPFLKNSDMASLDFLKRWLATLKNQVQTFKDTRCKHLKKQMQTFQETRYKHLKKQDENI